MNTDEQTPNRPHHQGEPMRQTSELDAPVYDRASTGWDLPRGLPQVKRPEGERHRCGPYFAEGSEHWGDHRVTLPGSTCKDVECHVNHHPTILPGWAEPMDGYHDRTGVRALAAAFWGWDAAGMHNRGMGDVTAWVAAHVALDALRDAGYRVVRDAEDNALRG